MTGVLPATQLAPDPAGEVVGATWAVPLTRFVGRVDEVAAVTEQVRRSRLVTLTGPGGSGKTRLAVTVCERLADEVPYGLWWVELAELDDPALLPATVAATVGVTEPPGSSLTRALARHFQGRAALLVLDNCEHLVEASAALVGHLLRACPRLRVLTTSREPLGVAGETTWGVGGLALPAAGSASAADLAGSEAVQLFVDRARLVHPSFELTDRDAAAVARLCRRLDGIPLALELAAARLRVLPLRQIVERLDDMVSLLVTTARDASPRHQTLRATLDWSYDLLPESERRLFSRLSVFRGGFSLEAAEAVADSTGGADQVLGLLARLVEKSLVQVHGDGEGEERYRLLEVVRQYAEERLDDQRQTVAARHASYYLQVAEQAEQHLSTGERKRWLDRLHRDHDNLRAALAWSRAHDPLLGIRLAGSVWLYCRIRGHYAEGREWLQAALSVVDDTTPPAAHAKALNGLGRLEFLQCEYGRAESRLRRALDLYGTADEPRGVAEALQVLGSIAREQGKYPAARSRHEESLAIWQRLGDAAGVAYSLNYLAFAAWLEADYPRANELAEAAMRGFRDLGDDEGAASALIHLGAAAYREGDQARARPLLQESLAMSRRLGFREGTAWSMQQLGLLAAARGEHAEAVRLLRDCLSTHYELGDRWGTASALEGLAGEVAAGANPRLGACLLAAAGAVRTAIGTPLPPCDRRDHERWLAAIEAALEPDELVTASAEGHAMSLDQAVAAAVAAADDYVFAGPDRNGPVSDRRVGGPRRTGAAAGAAGAAGGASAEPAAGELRVYALQRARVEVDGRPLGPEDWTYAKPRELMYHLLTRPGSTKAEIGLALWPDASAKELRNSFHTCMKHLRRALGDQRWVRFAEGGYRIDSSPRLWYDVDHFEAAAKAALSAEPAPEVIPDLAEAAGRYPGDFLVEFAVGSWAEPRREQLRRRYEQVMLTLGRLRARDGRYAEAAETFARLVEYDPFLEVAHRGLMRCHAAMGNRARAVRQYQQLVDLLDAEIGTTPAPETTALLGKLQRRG